MKMYSAGDVAATLGGDCLSTRGDLDRPVIAPCPVSRPVENGLTFVKRASSWKGGDQNITVLWPAAEIEQAPEGDLTIIFVANPRFAFARACAKTLVRSRLAPGIHPTAVVDSSSKIAPTATIGANCVVGVDCEVGENSVIHPNVVLYDRVRIGRNVVVNAGSIIGADGYGYERGDDGEFEKFPHIGGVVIEDDVEIGSNTCIDRGALADTLVKRGAKIDNLVHIAHNVVVGAHSAVIAHTMLGGSVVIGDYAWIAPSACIMNQKQIGDRATVGLQALVTKDVPSNETVLGSPAVRIAEFAASRRAMKDLLDRVGAEDDA